MQSRGRAGVTLASERLPPLGVSEGASSESAVSGDSGPSQTRPVAKPASANRACGSKSAYNVLSGPHPVISLLHDQPLAKRRQQQHNSNGKNRSLFSKHWNQAEEHRWAVGAPLKLPCHTSPLKAQALLNLGHSACTLPTAPQPQRAVPVP